MKKFILFLALLAVVPGFAKSRYVDSARLYECGGKVELRESKENLHLQFEDVQDCENLVIQTAGGFFFKGETLKQYAFNKGGKDAPFSPSYTLSKDMWKELSKRGKLVLLVTGYGNRDELTLRVNPWRGKIDSGDDHYNAGKCGGHSASEYTGYARTNSCKCAYYRRGEFVRHAEDYRCPRPRN